MFFRRILCFVQRDKGITDVATVRLQLFKSFLALFPHGAQPVQVHVRILEDEEVSNGIAVISQCGSVVDFTISIARFEVDT